MEFEGYPVYQQMMDVLLGSGAPEDLKTCVHPDFTGYGSAAHEIFKGRNDLMEMARRQMEQYDSLQLEVQRTALSGRFLDKGETYLISEEFLFINQDDNHAFPLRVTTLLQQTGKKWLVTHMHGSTPDSDIAEEEAFPEQGLRKKNEELEAKIRERTRELEIEASLERVRSRAMAMQASEELSELVITVFRELSNLDMVLTRCLIWIFNPIDDSGIAWMANSEDPDVADSYLVPYHDHPA